MKIKKLEHKIMEIVSSDHYSGSGRFGPTAGLAYRYQPTSLPTAFVFFWCVFGTSLFGRMCEKELWVFGNADADRFTTIFGPEQFVRGLKITLLPTKR